MEAIKNRDIKWQEIRDKYALNEKNIHGRQLNTFLIHCLR